MDFTFTPEQEDLRRAVRDVAADHAGTAQRRRALDTATGHDADLWRVLTDLGLPAFGVPEERGGSGGTFVDAAVVLEEAGHALFAVPLLPTIVAGFAADDPGVHAALAAGATAAIGLGAPGEPAGHVLAAGVADWLLLAGADGLYAGRAIDAAVDERPTLDPTRRQATVTLPVGAGRVVGDGAAADRAVDLLRIALAVEAVGVARWCLAATVDYLKTRVQFERPIGSFQALQHRAADLVVRLESAASAAYYAAWAAADSPAEVPVVAPLALSVCAEAAYRIAAETIQLHGGIGFTWEHDAHLYFKRATATRLILGDTHEQRRLGAARSGLLG
jgi:alkylation response protein AidB-like acyl-CoA dehydrogenase